MLGMWFLPANFLIANILILTKMWNHLKMHAESQGHMWTEGKYDFFLKCACHLKKSNYNSRFHFHRITTFWRNGIFFYHCKIGCQSLCWQQISRFKSISWKTGLHSDYLGSRKLGLAVPSKYKKEHRYNCWWFNIYLLLISRLTKLRERRLNNPRNII